jgi:hypothetical protein
MSSLSLGSGIQHKEQSVHHPITGLPDADLTQRKNLDAKFRKFCIAFLGDFLLKSIFLDFKLKFYFHTGSNEILIPLGGLTVL